MINLNNEKYINLDNYKFGSTQDIEIKIGRKIYMLDITKDSNSCSIGFYKRLNKVRNKYSKYEANLAMLFVKSDAMLDRKFFENMKEIQRAQYFLKKFKGVLKE